MLIFIVAEEGLHFQLAVILLSAYLQKLRKPLLILLINQIHNHFHHDVLFLGTALGNHQGEGDEGVGENTRQSSYSALNSHTPTAPRSSSAMFQMVR